MRVALLTHHWVPNFGANLQSLSSVSLMRRLGLEVTVINYRPPRLEHFCKKRILSGQLDAHETHCKTFLDESPVLRTEDDIITYCQQEIFDTVIAGSDSLFRIKRSVVTEDGAFPNPFWLLWTKKLKYKSRPRIAFLAPSTEGSYYTRWDSVVCEGVREALANCDVLSVRDRWSQAMVQYVTGNQMHAELCPDPVAVLNHEFSIPDNLLGEGPEMKGKYILLFASPKYLTVKWCRRFVELAHADGLQVYALPNVSGVTDLPVDRILELPMAPLTWYSWIMHAAGLISINFHPIACAVFNSVPFISIDVSGPTHFYCFAHREASKAYDMCMNVGAQRNSFLPLYVRLRLSADCAYGLIRDFDCNRLRSYADYAARRFVREVQRCVGTQ